MNPKNQMTKVLILCQSCNFFGKKMHSGSRNPHSARGGSVTALFSLAVNFSHDVVGAVLSLIVDAADVFTDDT